MRIPTDDERVRRWSRRVALATAVALGFAYLPYRLLDGSGARRAAQLRAQLERTEAAIVRLEIQNADLRRDVEALAGDRGAIEDIARSELGMVRPGEIVIRILDSGGRERPGPRR